MKVALMFAAFKRLTPAHQCVSGFGKQDALFVRAVIVDIKATKRHPSPLSRGLDFADKHRLPGENCMNCIPATPAAMAEACREGRASSRKAWRERIRENERALKESRDMFLRYCERNSNILITME